MPQDSSGRPSSPLDLFITFTLLALQGFGGVLAVAQRELCDRRRWLSHEQFVEILSIAQVLPGPNVVNVALAQGITARGHSPSAGEGKIRWTNCRVSSRADASPGGWRVTSLSSHAASTGSTA